MKTIKTFKKLILLSAISAMMSLQLSAKEPTNILFGVGIGAGRSDMAIEHSQVIQDPIQVADKDKTELRWKALKNQELSSWAVAWEFMLGYKHFINDFVGFRYYGNVGIQHYKPISLNQKSEKIGIIDYTLNADLLIDFWESEFFAVGVLGGMGFGGTSFEKNAITQYLVAYNAQSTRPIGLANVQKHYFNVNANVGFRVAFFQKVRRVKDRVCEDSYKNGKRICRVPVYYIGHNIEFNAKFPLLDYQATPYADIIVLSNETQNNIASRPGYKVTNPYRLTVRYVVDF